MTRTYGLMSLDEACEELLKLILFDRVTHPIFVARDKEEADQLVERLVEKAAYIEVFPLVESTKNMVTFPNGVRLLKFNSGDPDRLRGCLYDLVWMHNRGSWSESSFLRDIIMFGLRLGSVQTIMESEGD
jgi:hypothetical protein